VKEINYFDGVPIVSLREEVVNTSALNYENIRCGDFISGVITLVDEQKGFVEVQVNDFVKGRLYIEHMADYPLKVIPPKYRDVGKSIKVRVFTAENRNLEFTRKETLLKTKVPVF
jgi:ribosomal protein S1